MRLPIWERARYAQRLRDALRALDLSFIQGLVAEGLAEHDRIAGGAELEPWLYAPDDPGIELVLWLAQVRPDACSDLPSELWRRHVFGHGVLYRSADAATRDALIATIDRALATLMARFPQVVASSPRWDDTGMDAGLRSQLGALTQTSEWRMVNVALRMLAWIGDGAVLQWFQRQQTMEPSWKPLFYLSAASYASEGGWELTRDGERRDLSFRFAYQLVESAGVVAELPSPNDPGVATAIGPIEQAVAVMAPHSGQCQWCGRRLTSLLDLNLRHPALAFLGLNGQRLRIVMCEECSLWSRIFMEVNLIGSSTWSALNGQQEPDAADNGTMLFTPPAHQLILGPQCASPFEVVARGDASDVSQVGGMPSWIQDADYVICPACQRRMMFVGQVAPCAITDRAIDGLLYGLLCPDCLITTVTYQCT